MVYAIIMMVVAFEVWMLFQTNRYRIFQRYRKSLNKKLEKMKGVEKYDFSFKIQSKVNTLSRFYDLGTLTVGVALGALVAFLISCFGL